MEAPPFQPLKTAKNLFLLLKYLLRMSLINSWSSSAPPASLGGATFSRRFSASGLDVSESAVDANDLTRHPALLAIQEPANGRGNFAGFANSA